MAETKIEWTDVTWNPVVGCRKVSAGCAHCYAEKMAVRLRAMALKDISEGKDPGRKRHYIDAVDDHGRWTGRPILVPEALDDPYHWEKPRKVFVNSMSDLFHPDVPFGYVLRCFDVMAHTPQHTYQILTKHPDRMSEFARRWSDLTGEDYELKLVRGPEATRKAHPSPRGQLFADMLETMGEPPPGCAFPTFDWMEGMIGWPVRFPNVWLGTSVEDQEAADKRIPELLECRDLAPVLFLSCEPLLGPVDLESVPGALSEGAINCHYGESHKHRNCDCAFGVDWVIAGGESGPHARPSHPDWFRSLRDQCQAAGVPFFFKQWGEWQNGSRVGAREAAVLTNGRFVFPDTEQGRVSLSRELGWEWDRYHPTAMARVGKKAAGRLLDGREWNEFPQTKPSF